MLSSMTGFVSKTISLPLEQEKPVNLTINLKTLNSRFFEATCRLSYALTSLENELTKMAQKELKRGHMYLSMTLSDPSAFKSEITVSQSMVKGYLDALNQVQKKFNLPGSVTVNDLLHIPNIFVSEELSINEKIKERIFQKFTEALQELKKIRAAEGKALLVDLKKRVAIITQAIDQIKELFKIAFKKKQDDINSELMNLQKVDPEFAKQQRIQLYQELDRSDVHEEIVRFKTHIQSFDDLLKKKQAEKGRQLDFVLQELGREINTMAAKSDDSIISAHTITIKVELEKCREQIQNIV